ncbi:g2747 [Coccomyxa viridis]|uniref:Enhancer of polycomb-like protein n=1 Tax=Coccomyxa viridis TaxID=1274662 RepID=A0ABP1FQ47_9CHLO
MGQVPSVQASEVMEEPVTKRRKVVTAVVTSGTVRTTSRPLPAPKANTPRESEAARTVRPRPLHVNEKIRVLWQGRDPEWDEWDGGAFAKWMQACEDDEQQQRDFPSSLGGQAVPSLHRSSSQAFLGLRPQVVVVGHNSKPLAQDLQAEPAEVNASAAGLGTAAEPINVPKCRKLSKAKCRKRGDAGAAPSTASVEERYVRHVDSAASGAEHRVEYDMNDEDEAWLAKYNKQRLLSSTRGPRLSEDAFEGVIDSFEKGLHHVLEHRTELWPNVIEASREAPDIESIFPVEDACTLPEVKHLPKAAVKAAYSHWCAKRLKAKRPLLQRLWFEQPWVRVREASKEHCGAQGSLREVEAELPFMGQEAPRPSTRPRWIDADEAMLKLLAIRGDLEVIRTMADQVHRREKQRRRELLQWREDWHGVLSLDPAEALENLPNGPVSSASADRESRLANRAAMQAAREASTLIGAQVSLAAAVAENAEAFADGHISRTVSLNEDSAAPPAPQKGELSASACFWCSGAGSLVACNHCPRCFCYNCYKQRHSYGIINWAKVLRDPDFHCPVCTGKEPASNEGDSVPGAERPSATAGQKAASSRWRVGWSFLRGRGRRGRGRLARSSTDRDVKGPEAIEDGMLNGVKDLICLGPGEPLPTVDCSLPAKQEGADAALEVGVNRDTVRAAAEPVKSAARHKVHATRANGVQTPEDGSADKHVPPGQPGCADAAASKKKRATEATKLVEAAKRWEKVDGGLTSARGRNSASASAEAPGRVPRRGDNTKAEAASKKPEEPARAQASRTKRGQTEQEHAPSDRPTETDDGPEDVGIRGIQRVKRKVNSATRRTLRTEYLVTCDEHGAFRLDRVSRMAEFFAQHSACMPEWAALAQQPGESASECTERLRQIFSFHCDAAGCLIELVKAPESQSRAQKASVRAAAAVAKRKLGSTPTILTERHLPENRGGTCNTGGKQLTGTRSKTAPDQQDSLTLPSCQKQLEAVKKKAKLLDSHAQICKLDLPRRKASMHITMQSRGAMNGQRMPKRIIKGRTNGR